MRLGGNSARGVVEVPRTIVEWFERGVEEWGSWVAVADEAEAVSYAELDARANRLAHALRARGVGPEVLVGVCLERSVRLVVAVLGVLKAGAAYVPLDPTYPAERLRFMVRDGGVDLVLSEEPCQAQVPPGVGTVVLLDRDWETIARAPATRPAVALDPEHLAYVIYTSGSTGTPKGVQIPHRAVVNFLTAMRATPGLGAGDALLAVTTLSFDIAALELFLPLGVGARVELASRETAADARALAARLAATGATVLQATPVTWRMLVEAGWAGDGRLKMLCGGEALPRELATALGDRGGELWNMYGPTETTIWSAVHRVAAEPGPVPIGEPIAATQLRVLDAALRPVAPGAEGELCIGGAGLARGYRHRPDLTAERFVPDPFGAPGARLYRTGDLVRRRADGQLEFLGRRDHQVKVRGFRIELGEIETVLRRHPAVRDAVVVARHDLDDDARLVAYLERRPGAAPPVNELRALALQWLPPYMVPSAFAFLDAFPLTPNGKIDRTALPAPEPPRPNRMAAAAPAGATQQALVEIWSSVLRVSDLGTDENFFDLGGTSLLLLKVRDAIADRTGNELPLADLFRHPTIRSLAHLLEDSETDRNAQQEQATRQRARRRLALVTKSGERRSKE
jgi:amino acid adenylation domain-containing protein